MNTHDKLELLNKWAAVINESDRLMEAAHKHLGLDYEGKLLGNIDILKDEYTKAVMKLIDDQDDLLYFYWLDCEMGKTPQKVYLHDEIIVCESLDSVLKLLSCLEFMELKRSV